MGRRLLLLAYYFPPANIIGAVRPYQLAQYFQRAGWEVTVVNCADNSVTSDYSADTSNLTLETVPVPRFLEWINRAPSARDGASTWVRLSGGVLRIVKFLVRALIFPEHFVLARSAMNRKAEETLNDRGCDLIISTAPPFSIHLVARDLAKKYSIPWVADNRDLWASSPYRKVVLPRRALDCQYERSVLHDAKLVLGISQGIADYYKNKCRHDNTLVVMNGYSFEANDAIRAVETDSAIRRDRRHITIVYGGGLYGGVRDPSPLFEALSADERLNDAVSVRFYGSEPECVHAMSSRYSECAISLHGRVTKHEIANVYREASLLLVVLGRGTFENGVMTGKFFEYLSYCKPILAIAPEASELAGLINQYRLGFASNDPKKIAGYLLNVLEGSAPTSLVPPSELAIDYQLSKLLGAVNLAIGDA